MKVLFVINGLGFANNPSIGGGDKRFIEIIRHNPKKNAAQMSILTTETGYSIFYGHEKLSATYYITRRPRWWPKRINDYVFGRVLSYLYATVAGMIQLYPRKSYDIVVATSDNFFDILPAIFYKVLHKKKMLSMIHHYIQVPWKRKGNLITNILLFASQQLSLRLITFFTDALLLYETPEGKHIASLFSNQFRKKIQYVHNGIDTGLIDSVPSQKKIYDACFVGGLRISKGIFDLPKIWLKVIKKNPLAKLIIIGGYSDKKMYKDLVKNVTRYKLQDNIIFAGPLSGKKLFKTVKSSKVFLLPSYEEGWGIALCEALYAGLPVICYDLPAFKIFSKVIDKYPVGDTDSASAQIGYYLNNPKAIQKKVPLLQETAKQYSWQEIAEKELKILKNTL